MQFLWGCAVPPDFIPSPQPGPAPQVERDASLSGEAPIRSVLLESAKLNPDSHSVVLLETGDEALLARIHLIRSARRSIDIQTYIWVYDRCGSLIFRELLNAARRGVKVRILVDQFVPPQIPAKEYAALIIAHKNLELRLFRPISGEAINSTWDITANTFARAYSMNYRMHNKLMLVDNAAAIVGGRNYQDAYFDRDPQFNFLDREVIFMGPACSKAAESFLVFWNDKESYEASRLNDLRRIINADKSTLPHLVQNGKGSDFPEINNLANAADLSLVRPSLKVWPVDHIRYISDLPEKLRHTSTFLHRNPFKPLVEALHGTREEILLQTPYSIVGKTTYDLVRNIRKEKPDLKIRVSTNSIASSDHVSVAGVALKQRRSQIEDLGFELYLAKPVPGYIRAKVPRYEKLLQESQSPLEPNWFEDSTSLGLKGQGPRFCMHAKSLVIDRTISFVGSHNFDPRSFDLNTECGVMISGKAFSEHHHDWINRAMTPENSWVVARREYPPVIGELNGLLAMISSSLPLFDIWPLQHVSCFDLREGGEPVSPQDEAFYERYKDVGPLPGIDLGLKEIRVHLIRAFAGPVAPLM